MQICILEQTSLVQYLFRDSLEEQLELVAVESLSEYFTEVCSQPVLIQVGEKTSGREVLFSLELAAENIKRAVQISSTPFIVHNT